VRLDAPRKQRVLPPLLQRREVQHTDLCKKKKSITKKNDNSRERERSARGDTT
jgi:hypothetical protein